MATMTDAIHEPPTKRFKRNTIQMEKPMAIVLDIEGTIISKRFYENVLLPYTRDNIRDFLYQNSDFEHIFKRLEMMKDRYFDEYPEKEQLFHDYFTDSAYNQYLEDIKQKAIQQTRMNEPQTLQYNTKTNVISLENDVELIQVRHDNKNILEMDNKLKINHSESVEIIQKDEDTQVIEVINIDDNHGDEDLDEDMDIIEIDANEQRNKEQKNNTEHLDHDKVQPEINDKSELESVEIIENDAKESNDVVAIMDTDKDTLSGKQRNIVDIIDIDEDEDDDIMTKAQAQAHVIDIESDSDSEESVSHWSVLSKRSFYRERQIDLLMEIIDEWLDLNLKIKSLQYIQGLVMNKGFKSNEIKANIYSDCYQVMKKWKEKDDINIYIYSHGTKAAQQLIFKYSVFGDLSAYISDYFDKHSTGHKKDSDSYFQLLRDIQSDQWENCNEYTEDDMMSLILFISDDSEELEAAQNAGLSVIQSVREDVDADIDYDQITDFNQIEWIKPHPVVVENKVNSIQNIELNGHHSS